MKKLTLFFLVMMLFVLCGCNGNIITDTYWRNDKTGEWFIGLTENKVIYDCKVWNITSQTDKEDAYTIEAENEGVKLLVHMSKVEAGKRTITIDGKEAECSIIDGTCLPDYPEKDAIDTIANNNYCEGDSVTIVGWMKPLNPIVAWLLDVADEVKLSDDEVVAEMSSIYNGQELSFKAPVDAEGHFMLRVPIENTMLLYLKSRRGETMILAEPNETYFVMIDPMKDKKLFMGKKARLQNEICAHYLGVPFHSDSELKEKGGKEDILRFIKKETDEELQKLEEMCRQHPTLSERYKTYQTNKILAINADALMRCRFLMPGYRVPEAFLKAVEEDYVQKMQEPFTMMGYDFSNFCVGYYQNLETEVCNRNVGQLQWIMDRAEEDGIIKLSAQDREAIKQCDLAYPAYWEKRKNTPDSLQKVLDDEFSKNGFMKTINEITSRKGYQDYAERQFAMRDMEQMVKEMEERGWSKNAQDLYLSHCLCHYIDWSRNPLDKEMLSFAHSTIQIEAAKTVILAMNDKYKEIANRKIDSHILKSNDVVKGMTDGEKMLKKMIEPYKGKFVLIDVWGTWCVPCKEGLSHSQEEYERLKAYNIVYLYLANTSPEKSWKNVIREYNVMGKNVAHYNLPDEQQKAVEAYIGVHGYPTYKLVDTKGNLHDLNFPLNFDEVEEQIKRLSK